MSKELTPAERQRLKGRAHRLDPVVMIGAAGLTPAVVGEIERSLTAHELVKIKVTGEERARRTALMSEICRATNASPVQQIGKMLVIYRAAPPASAR